ncbi:MAG: hypothetical protein ACTTJE_05090 [Schwartzia sp. (in: firmicutes)]
MKWKRGVFLLALLVLCWGRPSCGACAETYTITEAQLLTLEENLAALQSNNAALFKALSESSADLTIAQSESEALREKLGEVERRLRGLRDELEQLRSESQNAKESLTRANRELQSAVESVKTLEKTRRRIERQRDLWEVVAVILGGIAVMS